MTQTAQVAQTTQTTLTRAELRDIRRELERERDRLMVEDPRRHTYMLALDRVGDGSYGLCQICGDDIAFDRLMAIPETPCCIGCGVRA